MIIFILESWSHWIREQLLLTWNNSLLMEFYIMQTNHSLESLRGHSQPISTNYRIGHKYQGLPNEKSNVRNPFPKVVLFSLVQLRVIIGAFLKTRSTPNHIHNLYMALKTRLYFDRSTLDSCYKRIQSPQKTSFSNHSSFHHLCTLERYSTTNFNRLS